MKTETEIRIAIQNTIARRVARAKDAAEVQVLDGMIEAYRWILGDSPQDEFDRTIGALDNNLSKMVNWGKDVNLEPANKQTLKHHAEDMIAAGEKILRDLGKTVEGTPQPGAETAQLKDISWLNPGNPRCPSMHGNQQCQWKIGHSGPHQECNEVWNHA